MQGLLSFWVFAVAFTDLLRKEGYRVESIAIVETMDWKTQTIKFRDQPVLPLENTKLKIM